MGLTSPWLASWENVTETKCAPVPRSSHAMAMVGKTVYVFGGENVPRVPVDSSIIVFDIDRRIWHTPVVKGDPPSPRVGMTMASVGSVIFVFGGRSEEHTELNDLYAFDTNTSEWRCLHPGGSDNSPIPRSYHAMAADSNDGCLFVFGGCGASGRLNDLWRFDLAENTWKALPVPDPSSGCLPRGGAGLAAVEGSVWVIGGFCGHELGDVHRFDLSKETWECMSCDGDHPSPRSVFSTGIMGDVIVIYGGEVDPSDQGHLGAGCFSEEVFVLDTVKCKWTKVEMLQGKMQSDTSPLKQAVPGPRGWSASACWGNHLLIYGGICETNERLEDMYMLSIARQT